MRKEGFSLDSYRQLNQFKAFFEYCEKNGVELTQDDKVYIKQSVTSITRDISRARAILHKYYTIYKTEMKNEPDELIAQNKGRYEANQFLFKLAYE